MMTACHAAYWWWWRQAPGVVMYNCVLFGIHVPQAGAAPVSTHNSHQGGFGNIR